MALISLPATAHAQLDRYWDPNGTAAGSGGTGAWNISSPFWSPSSDGVSGPYAVWNNAGIDNAVFGGVNGAVATVTLNTPIIAHNLTFDANTTYTLTGSTLTLAGATPTITTNGTATISSIIAGAGGLTKAGAGRLTLTGANSFSGGVNVTAGTLSVSGDSSLGAASNNINLSSGSALLSTGALNSSRVVTLLSGSAGIGAGVGSAHLTGAGGISLAAATTLSDNSNDFTGPVYAVGYNLVFTSIGNLGEASSLGAPTNAIDGTIAIGSGGYGPPGGGAGAYYTGAGATSDRNWSMRNGTGGASLNNQGTGALTLTGNISQNGPTTAFIAFNAQTADLALLGVISGARPITFQGGGAARSITLGGANTFSAPTTISGVTVRASSLANRGSNSSLGTGMTGDGTITFANGTLSYTGAGGGANRGLWLNGANSVLNDGAGALALSGAVTFNAAAPVDSLTLGGGFVGGNTLSGLISGSGGLIMNGVAGSSWLLGGANTYVGTTTVASGTLRAGGSQAFGALNAVSVNGGTLDLNGNDIMIASLAGTGGSVALNGGADLTVNGAAATSYGGSITGDGGLAKRGTGTLTLAGQSTYTGDTTINGGALALNFAAAGAPASDIISGASTLNMAGGTLSLAGAAGVANSQTFDRLNVTAGNNRIVATSGAGGGLTVNLGALARSGGLLDFTLPAGGAITTSNGDGALGWATINGADYAQVQANTITAFTAYANKDDAGAWLAGDVVSDAGGAANSPYANTVAGDVQLGGLKYTAAANSTVTVGGANTLGVDGTIIVASSVGNASQTITGGSLTGSTSGGTVGVLHNGTGTGTFTIASAIVDNGGATGFIKGGAGRVSLTGVNSYTGGTILSGGTLAIVSVADSGVASSIGASTADSANLVIESGTLEYTGAGATTTDRGFTLVNGGPSRTIQVTDAGGGLTFGGVVVGPDDASLAKTGLGTLTLANAANTYAGVTTVSAGLLSVNTLANGGLASGIGASTAASTNLVLQGAGGLQYTGTTTSTDRGFTLGTGGGRIDVSNAATVLTVSGVATGAGGLVKQGDGTLVLSAANLYQGGTTISAGTLRAGAAQVFGNQSALMNVATGATLNLAGFANTVGALSGGGNVVLGSATLTSAGASGTFTGAISGSGGFFRSGAGAQTILGCNNSYTGATSVLNSGLVVDCLADGGLASGIGASTNASANLVLNNSVLTYTGGSVSIDRGLTTAVVGAVNVANAANVLEFRGAVLGSGAFRKDGAGTIIMSGANTYAGGTSVTGGILRAGRTNAFGAGGVALNNTAGVVLDLNNFTTTVGSLNGGGALGGNVTLGSATLTLNAASGAASYAGAISGSGGLVKNGGYTQILGGCGSSYTGGVAINGGVLEVSCLTNGGGASAIGASGADAGNLVLNGGTLRYTGAGGSTDRLFTLGASAASRFEASGAGAIAFTGAAPIAFTTPGASQTLALGGSNTGANSLAAQITNNGAGVTSLTKDGAGTWILNNPNSSYTGVTTINGGVLGVDKLSDGGLASSIGASSAAAANLVIGNGSTLRYTGAGDTTNRLFTLSAGTTFIESSGAGAIVFTDTGLVTLADPNQARTIALGGTNTGANTLAGSIGNAGAGVTTLAKNDGGAWVLTGANTYTGLTNINAGTLILGNGGTTGAIASATINNFGVLGFNRSDTLIYGGVITQTGAVQQLGAGATILTGTNSYTGGTTISAGTLQLGNGGTTGSITGNVINDGVLTFNRSDVVTFNGVISGAGSVRQGGAGTTILAGVNSYAGGTAIDAGTLQVSSDANLGAAAGALSFSNGMLRTTANITSARNATLAGAGAVLTDAGTSFTLGGAISGAGGLTKSGAGALILTGASSYAGGTTISGGALSLGNGGATGSILGDVTNNGSLIFDRSNNFGFGGLVSGTGSVTQSGAGVVTLTANNSYTGVTDVNAGRLLINGDQSAATGLTSVASGAALGGSGIIGGNVNVASGGILAPGNSPGTMTINGDLSLASGSVLDFEFGQADVAGGPLNDLVNVGGNLVLDGTINVGVSAGGAFGGGLYRVFNYGGALTDNGLTLGLLPVGSNVTVQTSVAGQVNLINSVGLSLSFWDGDAGPKFNNVIDGGSGSWHLDGADNNWANADGSVNAAYDDGTLAIFAGTGGTVTVDNTGGAVTASGLQFASHNYLINGSQLTLIGPESMVRVGDGTAVGAGYTATIAAVLDGATRLAKTDLGTLVLTGANSYTGGTAINGGTLRIASDANLGAITGGLDFNGGTLATTSTMATGRAITLTGAGTFTNTGTVLTLTGAVTGGGGLTKSGTGTLVLTGDVTHSGGTTIADGTLQLGNGGATGSISGDILNNARLVVDRSDNYTYNGVISGSGLVSHVGGGVLNLTADSSWGGSTLVQGGELRIVSGNMISSGSTNVSRGGTLTVSGNGSTLETTEIRINGGGGAPNTVDVGNGGVLRTTIGGMILAAAPPTPFAPANLNISGAGSLVDLAGAFGVAVNNAQALSTITISDGGALRSNGANLFGATAGNNTASTLTITGAGSSWTSTGTLAMTNGAFSLLNGGGASFDTATIGSVSAAFPASLLVSGAGSSFSTAGNLTFGSGAGTGVVTLTEGGLLNVGGALVLADNAGATGVLNIGGGESLPAAAAGTLNTASVSLGSTTSRVNFNHTDPAYGFTALISGIGNVNQVAGTTILTGASSYTGATNVSGGVLIVNGDQTAATGLTTVAAGATIGGMGTIGGNVTVAGGAINPGDIGIAPGALTINGDLGIAAGSTLNVNLGQANVVGGAFNDLINVSGDLVLDGALNLQTSVGGSIDPGLYRLINYGGALTDNGLDTTLPPNFYVQTSIANQVNLVNTSGLQFRFWDGASAKNDGVVGGGAGVWQNFTGNDNWVDDGSIPNAPFADSAFAVFMGAAGAVTVDASLGAVNASGMQFLTDGYVVGGDAITLTGAQATIRVGDGTVAGGGATATIAAELTGTAQVLKSDLGTLILTGANSHTGGVAINAGVLQISADANLGDAVGGLIFNGGTLRTTADFDSARAVDLTGSGTLLTDGGSTLGLTGAISGAGNLVKTGTGTLILAGANGYSGSALVNAGAFFVNGDQTAATGLTSVAFGATLGGAGVIGGNVSIADGATLDPGDAGGLPGLLTINGGLSLAPNATLSMQFGQANVAGGPLNDLIQVGGDLVLDGTINVSAPTGGSFGPGIYRVFNYGGALTDNGLTLGTLPGGVVSVQTAITGQVNLVNTAGLTLSFWDGAAGPKNNNLVEGGNGVWRVDGGSNNWTDSNGVVNADYAQDSFAIFSAAPGTVSVDNSGGAVLTSGMQFASNGYVITGDTLTLTGGQALIQVGDGSAGGAGYTVTIEAALTGSAGLVKTDLGTLVLTGANSYGGGTTVDGGTLAIGNGGATGSITGDIVNNGALTVNRTGVLTLDDAISGTGTLTKLGSGTLILSGTNSYSGATTIGGGIVQVSSDANLGTVAGSLSLQGGVLQAGASFTSARNIQVGSPTANSIDTQGFNVTLAGTIGNGPNNSPGNYLNKLGSGTLTLTGANIYNNRTLIADGTLALAGAGAIGSGNLLIAAGAVFDISQTTTGARVIQLNSGPAGAIALGGKVLTLGLSNSFSDWSGTIADGGIAGGVGGRVVVATPGGAVRFFEANSYTGGTTVSSGTFELSGAGSLYSGGAVTVNGGATFSITGLMGPGTTIGDLSGAGAIALGGKTLTFGTGNSTAVTGAITGAGGGLVKTGAGTVTLGGANSYTGATNVTAGTLLVNGDQAAATGLTTVASGATLGGSGRIGGDVIVADGGTLAPGAGGAGSLAINGNLALGGGSLLDYQFGQANNPGGLFNDLVNVGGDLALDGALNVAITPGGAFDIGLYRIVNYSGALTDNGLSLGALPAGADVFLQTSVANQVNLINVGGATLSFWDGAAGPGFNGAVNGGAGVWQGGSGNHSWTDGTGAVNAGYADGAFAIFTGAAGAVTIDNSLGAVTASGLQFAVDGYTITGDALTLTGPQSVIRVGDGTATGAGYTATIGAVLTGGTQLVKTDAGTLTLTGANGYTGGTAINGGTLHITSDANLGAVTGGLSLNGGTLATSADMNSARAVDLAGAGAFRTEPGATLTLSGMVTGAGSLTKSGTGALVLSGTGSYAGATNVTAGTLLVNGDYTGATGVTTIASGASLGGVGTIGGDVNLAGTLAPGAGGVGTLTINGNLAIGQTATLDYVFGQADVAGGALNDLVNVGGNLTLDGTIDVTVPTGGAFETGIYRVFNYGGTLTDNGLTLGSMPGGGSVAVQTSIAGQVNLVNSAGLTLAFWDGAAGPKNNGVINGGAGVWQAGTGNDNWTEATGAVNAAYSDGAFAVFGGAGGTVTVDNGPGQVTAGGMQFAANGYTITGGAIALTGPQSTVRVGDGSVAGAGFTATIGAVLDGATQLIKTDAGTLVLSGANSYTGGTVISGGALQISSDANLGAATASVTLDGGTLATSANVTSARDIAVAGAGAISTASGTTLTFNGQLSGNGALSKTGAGTLLLTGDSSAFTGSTRVEGMLTVNGSLCGDVNVLAAGRLGGTGAVCTTVNAGTIAPGESIGTLTVAGSYTGAGGVLEIETELGGDSSPTDRLVVTNGTFGATEVVVINQGGLGGQTAEGVKIVDLTGGASNGAFTLRGDYLFEGDPAVIAGAFGYRLFQGGVTTPADGDWYLRSTLLDGPNAPEEPLYQPGVPLYESYAGVLQTLNGLPTLQERVGNRQWSGFTQSGVGMWSRVEGGRLRSEAAVSTSGADVDTDTWGLQVGFDAAAVDNDRGVLIAGVNGRYGVADARIRSRFGGGEIDTKGYSLGATLTWHGAGGFYADAQAQLSWYDSDLDSDLLGSLVDKSDGTGEAFSLEVGQRLPIGGGFSFTPQAQITYSNVRFDAFFDPNDALVRSEDGDSLRSRLGVSLDHQRSWRQESGGTAHTHVYSFTNFEYEMLDGSRANVSGAPLLRRDGRLWGQLGVGGSYSWDDSRFTAFSEISAKTALSNVGDSNDLKFSAGLRMRF
jgi:fibronectin-binding autotransporter adhesin